MYCLFQLHECQSLPGRMIQRTILRISRQAVRLFTFTPKTFILASSENIANLIAKSLRRVLYRSILICKISSEPKNWNANALIISQGHKHYLKPGMKLQDV